MNPNKKDRGYDHGFTLIEVLIAISLLSIAMLAALNAVVIAVGHNLDNTLRDEAVNIAEAKMNELRNTTFSSISSGITKVSRPFRRLTVEFTVTWLVDELSSTSKAVVVGVEWKRAGTSISHRHSITSIITEEVI